MTEIIEISDTNTDTSSSNTVNTGLGTVATDMYGFINSLFTNPSVVIILVVIIVFYVIIFMYLGESGSSTSTFSSTSQTESG